MDITTLLGIVAGLSAIFISILLGGSINAFLDLPSFMIVMGGTIAATLVNFPMSEFMSIMGVTKNAFLHKVKRPTDIIQDFIRYAELSRREGILALEAEAEETDDKFIAKGLQLAVDGSPAEVIREIMETELVYLEERHKLGAGIFEALGTFAPAFGMIGTLIGLINMLKNLEDPTQIGAGMAIALITTFYGAVLANLFFLPMAGKLKSRSKSEALNKEVTIQGIMSLQAGDNPRVIEEKLKAFLAPKMREAITEK